MMQIHHIRENYTKSSLSETEVNQNPITQFNKWLEEALASQVLEPTAFTLCTTGKDLSPSGRIVLLKYVEADGFVFFTNYNSHKGQDISYNPNVGMVFFWPELQRQVNIQGVIEKTPSSVSDEYFYSRPIESQIGAVASNQSAVINSREELEQKIKVISESLKIERPANWGGYKIIPSRIEFWQGRANRVHDRIVFSKENHSWNINRLSP